MPAIDVPGRPRQLIDPGIVERCHRHCIEGAAQRFQITLREHTDPAGCAEAVVQMRLGFASSRPLILRQGIRSGDHLQLIRLHEHEPRARLTADGVAAAAKSARCEVAVSLVAHRAAMTLPEYLFKAMRSSNSERAALSPRRAARIDSKA